MNRLFGLAAILALVLGMYAARTNVSAEDKEKKGKVPTIKEVMKKIHIGDMSALRRIDAELKADEPDWALVSKLSKQLEEAATVLSKNKPPRGDVKNWKKVTGMYKSNAVVLSKAAKEKKKTGKNGAVEVVATLKKSCAGCHGAHKPKDDDD
jgi:hypothetical protein